MSDVIAELRGDEYGYVCRLRHQSCDFEMSTDLMYYRSIEVHEVSPWNVMVTRIELRYCRPCLENTFGSPSAERQSILRVPYWYKCILMAEVAAGRQCRTVKEVCIAEVTKRFPQLRIIKSWEPVDREEGKGTDHRRGILAVCEQYGQLQFGPECLATSLQPCDGRVSSMTLDIMLAIIEKDGATRATDVDIPEDIRKELCSTFDDRSDTLYLWADFEYPLALSAASATLDDVLEIGLVEHHTGEVFMDFRQETTPRLDFQRAADIFRDRLAAVGKTRGVVGFYSDGGGVDKAYLTKIFAMLAPENIVYFSFLVMTKRVFKDCVSYALKVLLMDLGLSGRRRGYDQSNCALHDGLRRRPSSAQPKASDDQEESRSQRSMCWSRNIDRLDIKSLV